MLASLNKGWPQNMPDFWFTPIDSFLNRQTPQSWIDEAIKPEDLPNLLRNHANFELKA
jgi:tRNA isopentenyl-2-thiomethyl-A-37 hydroxylase MiaE